MYSSKGQVFDHHSKVKASIETITELRQVTGQMFLADSMIGAPEIVFHVADHGVDHLNTRRASSTESPLAMTDMGKPSVIDTGKTAQGIGDHYAVSRKMFARPASDLLNGKILDSIQAHGDRVPLQVG